MSYIKLIQTIQNNIDLACKDHESNPNYDLVGELKELRHALDSLRMSTKEHIEALRLEDQRKLASLKEAVIEIKEVAFTANKNHLLDLPQDEDQMQESFERISEIVDAVLLDIKSSK